mmetsp:Transcript_4001/g.9217  ORF Transcript_4001/g.9217 Transcript_4001/m.9217 type:complete len:762 (+) Transcript_4001:2-2287(+)
MATVADGKTEYSNYHPSSIEKSETRCQQILECRRQIKSWQDKLNRLLVEQERYFKLAKLRSAAGSTDIQSAESILSWSADTHFTWSDLSWIEKQDKDFILAALESKELPLELKSFDEDVFPLHIRTDPEIFMARVHHESFEVAFRDYAGLVVPRTLCDDKNIMLEVVQRQPMVVESMPDHWRDDPDIFRSVLKHQDLPWKLLQYFSKEIRSDAELMLAVFQHRDSELSWMGDCSERLRDDKVFFINAVDKFRSHCTKRTVEGYIKLRNHNEKPENQVLRYASQRLRSDFDVVMSCVRQSGMNLEHASDDLRGNDKIVMAACAQDYTASMYSLPLGLEISFLEHYDFARSIIADVSAETLKLSLDKHGDEDEQFCLDSILNENLDWSMIPETFRSDTKFVSEAAKFLSWRRWEALPLEMKRNVQIASALVESTYIDREIIWDVLHKCPEVLSDRKLVMDLIANHQVFHIDDLHRLVITNSVIDIPNDKGLMLHAVKHHPRLWKHCSEELRGDNDILIAVAEASSNSLQIVPSTYQLDHPEFVACVIQKHVGRKFFESPGKIKRMYNSMLREMWHNRAVAMAWLEAGGKWSNFDFPPAFSEDGEMILTATKHFWAEFRWASDRLKSVKAFVIQALAVDARIIRFVSEELFFDHNVVMAAFSTDVRAIEFYAEGDDQSFAFLVSFAKKIRRRLLESRTFIDEFIGSAKCPSAENVDCNLSMLNQGPVMLATYEDKIASYAGILHEEEELARYESTSHHLAAWGI